MQKQSKAHTYPYLPHAVVEKLGRSRLTTNEFRVAMAIIRFTYGFSRDKHTLTSSFVARATGLQESAVRAAMKRLESCRIASHDGGKRRRWQINEDVDSWLVPSRTRGAAKNAEDRKRRAGETDAKRHAGTTDDRCAGATDARCAGETQEVAEEEVTEEEDTHSVCATDSLRSAIRRAIETAGGSPVSDQVVDGIARTAEQTGAGWEERLRKQCEWLPRRDVHEPAAALITAVRRSWAEPNRQKQSRRTGDVSDWDSYEEELVPC